MIIKCISKKFRFSYFSIVIYNLKEPMASLCLKFYYLFNAYPNPFAIINVLKKIFIVILFLLIFRRLFNLFLYSSNFVW